LPDIGDPFDVAAFNDRKISDDQDAFVTFRQAAARLSREPDLPRSVRSAGPGVGWSKADAKLRQWVEANREVLELFKRAARQLDGIAHPIGTESAFSIVRVQLGPFIWLAVLEGSRLEERGDMAGAWACYRAVLAMRAHLMRRGTAYERLFAELNGKWLPKRVAAWAADPRTEVLLLRRALDDVIEIRPRPEWDLSSLKVDYMLAMRELDRPIGLTIVDDDDLKYRIGGEALPPKLAWSVYRVRMFLLNEPERSRRILRLVFANWLAHVQDPAEGHRRPVVRASFKNFGEKTGLLFYAPGPNLPAGGRRLSPPDMARWLLTAHDAKLLLGQWPWPSIQNSERRGHRALLVLLATKIYRRERGEVPPSEEALVGTYLESLPDDGTADLDDGMIPTVEEARVSAPQATSESYGPPEG
jgi:hypothetical protein